MADYVTRQEAEQKEKDVASAITSGDNSIDNTLKLLCRWKFSEVSGTKNVWVTQILNGIGVAIALLNAYIQAKIMDLKKDLADSYYEMAKYKWERFINNYMPLEKKLLQEVSTVAIATMNCDDDRARAESAVNSAYALLQQHLARLKKSLHICIDENMLYVLETRRVLSLIDTENFNLSDDRYWCDILNDDRWNKRSNVLDLGRNISTIAQSYGKLSKQAGAQVAGQADTAANAILTSIGYFGARNDTYYPDFFLSSAASNLTRNTETVYTTLANGDTQTDFANGNSIVVTNKSYNGVIDMSTPEQKTGASNLGASLIEANRVVELAKMQI